MGTILTLELAFTGATADEHAIDLYDVAEALTGFQRSLALTTHLILNNEIITQAPSLSGASILAEPPEPGSWKVKATVVAMVAGGAYHVTTAPRDTPLGNLVSSAYDYVISETMGFHVDYDKTLGQQREELEARGANLRVPDQSRLDSLAEKCEVAIRSMHRPIVRSASADEAKINVVSRLGIVQLGQSLNRATFDYIARTDTAPDSEAVVGRVSSYNSNTYKGRVFVPALRRPVPFELLPIARKRAAIKLITSSLSANALNRDDSDAGLLVFTAFAKTSRSGVLKGYDVTDVRREER